MNKSTPFSGRKQGLGTPCFSPSGGHFDSLWPRWVLTALGWAYLAAALGGCAVDRVAAQDDDQVSDSGRADLSVPLDAMMTGFDARPRDFDVPPARDADISPRDAIVTLDTRIVDAEIADASVPTPGHTEARFPWNGYATGSVWGRRIDADHHTSRRPTFQWTAVPDADHYELRLDDECTSNATCPFPNPEIFTFAETRVTLSVDLPVSLVRPVGTRYYWSVRACRSRPGEGSACSQWTATRYLDVGRDRSDYNGDGFGDLAVSASAYTRPEGGRGIHYVFYGSSDGLAQSPGLRIMPAVVEGASNSPVANVGDLNADGYADFATMGSNRGAQGGGGTLTEPRVDIHYGSSSGLDAEPSFSLVLDRPCKLSYSGAVGVGDLNGDGFADVAVRPDSPSACSQERRFGQPVLIYYGADEELVVGPRLQLEGPFGSFGSRARMSATGVGDVDGDGYPDLAVGIALYAYPRPGLIYRGSAEGLSALPAYQFDRPEQLVGARVIFPSGVPVVGDVNGDGFADVVATMSPLNQEEPGGRVLVYPGSSSGPAERPSSSLPNPDSFYWFGASIAGGDLNGDGLRDVVFSAGHFGAEAVRDMRVHFGGADGLSLHGVRLGGQVPISISIPGDFNGDGVMDLAVGTMAFGGATTMYILYGATDGVGALVELPTPDQDDPGSERAFFGLGIARSPL